MSALVTCHYLAIRRAARQTNQHDEQHRAPFRLTLNHYSGLAHLPAASGPASSNELAGRLVIHRTTLNRNLGALLVAGFPALAPAAANRRAHLVALTTTTGHQLIAQTKLVWATAQAQVEGLFGPDNALPCAGHSPQFHALDRQKRFC